MAAGTGRLAEIGSERGRTASGAWANIDALVREVLRWTEDALWREASVESLAPGLVTTVEAAVRNGTRLRLLLPAFPAKSANRQKTTEDAPDLGDVLALHRLELLCQRLGRLHAPGAEVVLCSDGRVFADVVGVTEASVSRYRDGIARAIAHHGLFSLKLYCLEDAYGGDGPELLRQTLVREFAVTTEALAHEIATSDARRAMFNGIHRFLFEDVWASAGAPSKNRARELAKPFAYETVRRSDAWSRLVAAKFPGSLRLSIHPQLEGAEKIPVRLLPSDDRWATPWHRSLAWDGRRIALRRREDIEAEGGQLSRTDDGYAYWRLGNAEALPKDHWRLAEEAFR